MSRTTLHIIWLGFLISLVSIGNFLSLVLHINIYILAVLMSAAGAFLYRYISRNIEVEKKTEQNPSATWILAAGIILLTGICALLVRKHGDTDAIGNWNFAAKYVADPEHWQQLFLYAPDRAHADYPMGYFGGIAFFWRLFGTQNEIVSLVITYFATVTIPVIIFLELYKKHLPVATAILALFIANPFYLNSGLNQYADVLLSFYILLAFISMRHFKKSGNKVLLLLCSAALGASVWVKNEGIFTLAVFGIFYFRTFLSRENIKHTLIGISPFIIALAIFRLGYRPANDVATLYGNSSDVLSWLVDKSRYKLIAEHFSNSLSGHFMSLMALALIYFSYSILARKNLSRDTYLLLTILIAYLGVYVITPHDLEFHLRTSLERLILELYPSFLLVIGLELSKIKLPQAGTEEQK